MTTSLYSSEGETRTLNLPGMNRTLCDPLLVRQMLSQLS